MFVTPMARPASRRRLLVDVLQELSTLVPLTICGLAVIFLTVLADVVGGGTVGAIVGLVTGAVTVGSISVRYFRRHAGLRDAMELQRQREEARTRAEIFGRERTETRLQLERGFAHLGAGDGQEGLRVLRSLDEEFEAILDCLGHPWSPRTMAVVARIPDLAEETYRSGISALSDAFELIASAEGPRRARIGEDLDAVATRLEAGSYDDERARLRDEQRRASQAQLLARLDEARRRATDLLYEAERCTAALADARVELASARVGGESEGCGEVSQTLLDAITCVREVQDELRAIGF